MKIIGKSNGDKYIAEIEHYEIERFLDLYYDKLKMLKPGDEIDLGEGYKIEEKLRKVFDAYSSLIASHSEAIKSLTRGVMVFHKIETLPEKKQP